MEFKITNQGFPMVTLSKLDGVWPPSSVQNDIIYAERNACVACSPIF